MKLNRLVWCICRSFISGVQVLNSAYCSDCKEEQELGVEDIELIIKEVCDKCNTLMVDDAIVILQCAQRLRETGKSGYRLSKEDMILKAKRLKHNNEFKG